MFVITLSLSIIARLVEEESQMSIEEDVIHKKRQEKSGLKKKKIVYF